MDGSNLEFNANVEYNSGIRGHRSTQDLLEKGQDARDIVGPVEGSVMSDIAPDARLQWAYYQYLLEVEQYEVGDQFYSEAVIKKTIRVIL